jgi:hypothetical protein
VEESQRAHAHTTFEYLELIINRLLNTICNPRRFKLLLHEALSCVCALGAQGLIRECVRMSGSLREEAVKPN